MSPRRWVSDSRLQLLSQVAEPQHMRLHALQQPQLPSRQALLL
jgi:hypothetical protein